MTRIRIEKAPAAGAALLSWTPLPVKDRLHYRRYPPGNRRQDRQSDRLAGRRRV